MSTTSAYLDRVREELWAREMFSFTPDRDLPVPDGTAADGEGPRLLFAGFPSDYSLAFLLALLQLDVQLAGIVTSPGAHPAILGDNALSRIAAHLRVPLIRAWRINDEHSRMQIAELRPAAVVMASFDQIVARRTLDIPPHGWMNIHPSLLPEYRGPEPVYWAIAEGAERSGITLHRAVPRVDAGGILAQNSVSLAPDETAGTLTRKLAARGAELLSEAVDALLDDAPGRAPDMSLSSYRGPVGHRSLRSAATAVEAERWVRAGVPNMPAWAELAGHDVYVRAARLAPRGRGSDPCLSYPDHDLEILEHSAVCGCHHNLSDCPHRARDVAAM